MPNAFEKIQFTDGDQTRAIQVAIDEATPRGKSPQRPIRIPKDPWYPAVDRGKRQGYTIGEVTTNLLARYAAGELEVEK